ncbi:MAG: hypothetical protein ABIG63_08375 [Chloroflexota bacterium]
MRRAEVTRAEILGWVGMLPMMEKGKRFGIHYTNTAEFLDQINQIQKGEGNITFVIRCTQNELNQFDAEKHKRNNEASA